MTDQRADYTTKSDMAVLKQDLASPELSAVCESNARDWRRIGTLFAVAVTAVARFP